MNYWIKYSDDYIGYEFKKVSNCENPLEALNATLRDIWVYDSDNDGEDTYIVTIHDEQNNYCYFIVQQDYYWDDGYMENTFYITQQLVYNDLSDDLKKKVLRIETGFS